MLRWSTLAALVCGAVLLAPVTRVDAALNDTIVTGAASPYELVIIEVEGCTYCDVLRRDVMPAFNASPEARELPVRCSD